MESVEDVAAVGSLSDRVREEMDAFGLDVVRSRSGFRHSVSLIRRPRGHLLVAIVAFMPADSLDEVVVVTAAAGRAPAAAWELDVVGPTLTVEDLRYRGESSEPVLTSDPDTASAAVQDFLARVRPIVESELDNWIPSSGTE
jgi:hypothetical protein